MRRPVRVDHKDKVRWFVTERGLAALAAGEIPAKTTAWLVRPNSELRNSEAANGHDPNNAGKSDSVESDGIANADSDAIAQSGGNQ